MIPRFRAFAFATLVRGCELILALLLRFSDSSIVSFSIVALCDVFSLLRETVSYAVTSELTIVTITKIGRCDNF